MLSSTFSPLSPSSQNHNTLLIESSPPSLSSLHHPSRIPLHHPASYPPPLFVHTHSLHPPFHTTPSSPSYTYDLTPLFISIFPPPFTVSSPPIYLTTFHAMIKAYTKDKSSASFLQIYIFTLLHLYRTKPTKLPNQHPTPLYKQ